MYSYHIVLERTADDLTTAIAYVVIKIQKTLARLYISSQTWKVADSNFNWLLAACFKDYKCHKISDGEEIAELL